VCVNLKMVLCDCLWFCFVGDEMQSIFFLHGVMMVEDGSSWLFMSTMNYYESITRQGINDKIGLTNL
jgi:hypothetical protein